MIKNYYFLLILILFVLLQNYNLSAQDKPPKTKEQRAAESKTLSEVKISVRKASIERKMEKTIINVEGSTRFTGTTVVDVLQKSPGITVDRDDRISMSGKAGVLFLIDGKQTYLSAADLTNLLKSMQSSEVESIELISSPSAKYDASGTAGIINIRTKKNKSFGMNGTANLGAGYGLTPKYNGGANLNFRTGKLNIFSNYNYSDDRSDGKLILNRIVRYGGTRTTFLQQADYHDRKNNNSYKAGLDYVLNSNHTLGFLVNGYHNERSSPANPSLTTINAILPDQSVVYGRTLVNDNNQQRFINTGYNLNYNGKLDTMGRELSADLDYSDYHGKNIDYRGIDTLYGDHAGKYFVGNNAFADIRIRTLKIDYTHPFNNTTKLEAGLKSSWITTDNQLEYKKSIDDEQHFELVPEYSNRFIYTEKINAAYLNFSKQFVKLGMQMGLRTEQTNTSANLVDRSDRNYHYLNLFPSAALSYKLTETQSLNLSYSRRIDRPDYDNLNPSLREIDNKTFWKGNEFLRPQYSDNFELSHSFSSLLTTSISYTHITDAMVQVTEQDDATAKTYVISRNLNHQKTYSLNMTNTTSLFKWWQLNNNLTIFYTGFNYTYDQNDYHGGQTSFSLNMNHTFNLTSTLIAETSIFYQSGQTYGLDKIKSFSFIDAGLRKSFLDKALNIKLGISDIFNKRVIRGATNYQGIDLIFNQKRESRIGRIAISYRFGNTKIKESRRRADAVAEESGRTKQ